MSPRALSLLGLSLLTGFAARAQAADTVFVEAESLASHGGWKLDTSFTNIVGSPYLLAHGLGKPVDDAAGSVRIPSAGEYRVWVRTKDWVAHWKAAGTPGRFQLIVNGQPVAAEFGTKGAEWHWQAGGKVTLPAGDVKIALHDLTGFDGRADAILFSKDASFTPPEGDALVAARSQWNSPKGAEDQGEYDLVVVGGDQLTQRYGPTLVREGCVVGPPAVVAAVGVTQHDLLALHVSGDRARGAGRAVGQHHPDLDVHRLGRRAPPARRVHVDRLGQDPVTAHGASWPRGPAGGPVRRSRRASVGGVDAAAVAAVR
jgi:hypothetical protein